MEASTKMIKKIVISILCMLVLTSGFSFGVLAEQNKKNLISEPGILDSETAIFEVSPDNDNTDIIPSISFLDTLDQQQTQDCNYSFAVTGNNWFAQSFIPTLDTLTRVELKLYKKGTLNTLIVSIKSNLTGPDLTWIDLPGTSIPTNKTWYECDFPDISVTPGNTYYIVWTPLGGHDCVNNSYWCFGINNPYINGFISIYYYFYGFWGTFNPANFSNPDFCFKTYGLVKENNPPNKPAAPIGDSSGKIGVSYAYKSSTTDTDGDQIYYLFDWGDGNTSGWLGPFNSGTAHEANHTWATKGSYNIKVKAKDIFGAESLWSDPLPITMPYTFNSPLLQFLELLFQRFPNAFPLLRQLLG
jgi:hypothetical protein